MTSRPYQRDYSKHFSAVLDGKKKTEQGLRLAAVMEAAGCGGPGPALDLGCSAGFNTKELCRLFDFVVGFDLDQHAVRLARERLPPGGALLIADGLRLPFRSGVFKAILCSQVHEHVPDPAPLVAEIERVLAGDGVICLGATNRWIVMEPHYRLPLLSWLPRRLADLYLRRFRGIDHYYENLLSYGQLRRLFAGFRIEDFSLRMVQDPERFHCRDLVRPYAALAKLPGALLRLLLPLFPSFVWILRKRDGETRTVGHEAFRAETM